VLVPYAEHGETEQRARAARLAELGLADVLDGAELSPDALAAAIDRAAVAGKPPAWEFDSRGAARSAEIIGGMIGAARHAGQDPWTLLDAEIDAWHAAGSTPTLWCRDDDACRDTPALRQLFAIAEAHGVPVAVAVIPALLEPNLIGPATTSRVVTVIQHGYAHRNHAGPEERKRELGAHRPRELIAGELARGLGALQSAFGPRFAAALVPPWNRIDPEVIALLPAVGFHGLSTMGPRAAVAPVPGIVQCNAHVDVVAWRGDRQFIGVERAVTRLLRHLRARREGSVDAEEPTGILTHHLVMSGDGWTFLAALMARTQARGVTWLDARAAFAVAGPASVTSGRSA
jgi:hypothetical protein